MQFQLLLLISLVSAEWEREFDPLEEPKIYLLENGNTYYLRTDYCNLENSEIEMKGRCYSISTDGGKTYSTPYSPGPTLKVFAGTTFTIRLVNNFVNSFNYKEQNTTKCHNKYCGMDVTNLHTHGLHISSQQDDVLRQLLPRETEWHDAPTTDYTYTIMDEHYPGIHWYHPHNHGSVSHQIHFGLFGALITEYPNNLKYEQVGDKKLFTGYDFENTQDSYKTNILIFSGVYAVQTEKCDCNIDLKTMSDVDINNVNKGEGIGAYGRCNEHGKECFHQYSACYECCAFANTDWDTSDFKPYHINIIGDNNDGDGIDQFIFVNGQYNPTVQITVNKFRRLQFINAMTQYYIQYQLPTQCEIYLLGYDGVFFDNDFPRNLNTYGNQLILSPGSRGDLLIKCDSSGWNVLYPTGGYQVYTISKTTDTDLDGLERAGSDADNGQKPLFWIQVGHDEGDEQTELPNSIPNKPEYLKDLTLESVDNIDNNCACNQYIGDNNCGNNECCILYNSKSAMVVNGEAFKASNRYLTYLLQDKIYEFKLKTDRHVHHQHVYPFQLQSDIANGFIGKQGDWFDTIGAEFERNIRIYTKDFSGYMVLHCHLLPHEDQGMMGLFYVLNNNQIIGTQSLPNQDLTSVSIQQCKGDLIDGKARSFTSPVPLPTEKVKGSGGGGGKKGNALLFDSNNTFILILVSIFIVLTICNTMVIIYKYLLGTDIVRKKKYIAVIGEDIDEVNDL